MSEVRIVINWWAKGQNLTDEFLIGNKKDRNDISRFIALIYEPLHIRGPMLKDHNETVDYLLVLLIRKHV